MTSRPDNDIAIDTIAGLIAGGADPSIAPEIWGVTDETLNARDNATDDEDGGNSTDPNDTSESDERVREEENQTTTGIGGGGEDEETQLTILTGEEMEWFFDKSTGKWYVSYGMPDSDRKLIFEATPGQMDALFGENQRPTSFGRNTFTNLTARRNITFGGNIAEMEGEGSFENEVARVKALALDNGALPEWAEQTPEYMDLVFIAQSEGKSQDWLLEQISKTQGFKDRFPGIGKLQKSGNLSLADAITGFLEMEAGVRAAVNGIGGATGKITPDVVGGLLERGHNLNTVNTAVSNFKRMQDYRPAMWAFNNVLKAQGLEPVRTLQQQFDFMAGSAPAELYDVWEASSVSEAARSVGLGKVFTAEDAIQYAKQTEGSTSLADATGAFQQAAQLILRLRNEVDVGKFGLNQDDLIDLSLGQAPRSGTSGADLQANINRAVLSAQASLQAKAKPFTGFTSEGTPQRASLGGLRQSQ